MQRDPKTTDLNRRQFLKGTGAVTAGALGSAGAAVTLSALPPGHEVRLQGSVVATADADGRATVSLAEGSHELTL